MKKSCHLFEYARASGYNLFNQRQSDRKPQQQQRRRYLNCLMMPSFEALPLAGGEPESNKNVRIVGTGSDSSYVCGRKRHLTAMKYRIK